MSDQIAYLLGAGASIDAGMPPTEMITECVRKKGTRKSADAFTNRNEELAQKIEYLICRWQMLGGLKRDINYEDIYFLAYQIKNIKTPKTVGEFDNPAVVPFAAEFNEIFKGESDSYHGEQICEHIENVVVTLIREKDKIKKTFDYLDNLFLYPLSQEVIINIFTLNHDQIIEQFLRSKEKKFCDGFTEQSDTDVLDTSVYDTNNLINLYKIHGSIDWKRAQYNDSNRDVIIRGSFNNGILNIPIEDEKIILCGTLNKMFQYHQGEFAYLWTRFYVKLMQCNRLIIAGYGFGDRAVNNSLIHWIGRVNRRMLIIDCKSEMDFTVHLERNTTPYFSKVFTEDDCRIKYVNSKIDELKEDCIEEFLKT